MFVFRKETWDTVKAFFDAMKVPLVLLILALVFIYPYKIKDTIHRAGFRVEEINLAGFRLAEEAQAELEGTSQKLTQVTAALAERDRVLGKVAANSQDPTIAAQAKSVLQGADAIAMSALATADRAAMQATDIGATLQSLPVATGGLAAPSAAPAGVGGYLIVFGADLDIPGALDEINRIKDVVPADKGSFGLFKKGSFYRSAAIFDTPSQRDGVVEAIEAKAGRRVEPVSLDRWCPQARPADGSEIPVFQC